MKTRRYVIGPSYQLVGTSCMTGARLIRIDTMRLAVTDKLI